MLCYIFHFMTLCYLLEIFPLLSAPIKVFDTRRSRSEHAGQTSDHACLLGFPFAVLWVYLSLSFANLNILFLPKPLKCSEIIVQNVLPLQINDLLKNIPFRFGNTPCRSIRQGGIVGEGLRMKCFNVFFV